MMKSNAVVSAQFDALNKLKVPITVNLANFVAAIIKAAATRGKSRLGASNHITEADIASITRGRMSLAAEANAFMVRAKQICSQIHGDFDKIRGDMECDMVDFVLNKVPKEKAADMSLQTIVDNFIRNVSTPTDEGKSKSVEPASSTDGNYVFDPSRDVAQQTLSNLGWKIGNIVSPRKVREPCGAVVQYEIGYINDDGSIGLHPILESGETQNGAITIIKAENIKEYKQVDKALRLSIDAS